VDEDASKVIVSFTDGRVGAYTNRAIGPGAVIVTATEAVWTRAPLVPVMVTAYEPALAPVIVQVDAWVPLRVEGTHEVATPAGEDAAVSETVPVNPPVDCREIVDVAD